MNKHVYIYMSMNHVDHTGMYMTVGNWNRVFFDPRFTMMTITNQTNITTQPP